jgi:glycerophosphoryl diester phosphodiesterase
MKKLSSILLVLLGSAVLAQARVAEILRQLRDPDSSSVLVVVHRADWRNAPENSLNALRWADALISGPTVT